MGFETQHGLGFLKEEREMCTNTDKEAKNALESK